MKRKEAVLLTLFMVSSTIMAGPWLDHERSLSPELKNHSHLYVSYSASQIYLGKNAQSIKVLTPLNGITLGYSRCTNFTTHNTAARKEIPLFFEWGVNATWQYTNDFRKFLYPGEELIKIDGYKYAFNYVNIAVPLNVSYRFSMGECYFMPFAGFNVKFNLLAEQLIETPKETDKVNYMKDEDVNNFKRAQLGYNVGARFGYKFVNIGYTYQGECMPLIVSESGNLLQGTHMVILGFDF